MKYNKVRREDKATTSLMDHMWTHQSIRTGVDTHCLKKGMACATTSRLSKKEGWTVVLLFTLLHAPIAHPLL